MPIAADPILEHTAHAWVLDMAMLAVLGKLFAEFVRWRLRLKAKA